MLSSPGGHFDDHPFYLFTFAKEMMLLNVLPLLDWSSLPMNMNTEDTIGVYLDIVL